MRYEFVNEFEVDHASAADVWAIYSSPNFPTLTVQLVPNVLKSKDILEGDGHNVGTVLRVVLLPGHGLPVCKEKYVTVDHEKRFKEIQTIEGGYLELGCNFSMLSFEILAKEGNSCVIKTVTKYEIDDDLATSVSGHLHTYLDTCVTIARAVSKRIAEQGARAAN
ncbi:S-norcoclaurine synthase 2-like [Papaver somniferum]|uniref:S-norcoclaurine synthase 2-like n=1 Tax=Papaver somniferum TaxID=3469 RepID=UPI000E6FA0BA|nr:S-norcoclaurine synthase 2-like [Papaver somniferum]